MCAYTEPNFHVSGNRVEIVNRGPHLAHFIDFRCNDSSAIINGCNSVVNVFMFKSVSKSVVGVAAIRQYPPRRGPFPQPLEHNRDSVIPEGARAGSATSTTTKYAMRKHNSHRMGRLNQSSRAFRFASRTNSCRIAESALKTFDLPESEHRPEARLSPFSTISRTCCVAQARLSSFSAISRTCFIAQAKLSPLSTISRVSPFSTILRACSVAESATRLLGSPQLFDRSDARPLTSIPI